MTGFKSKRQAAQEKMELADAYASAVAETPNMPTPLERRLSTERIERARNALESALEQQAEPVAYLSYKPIPLYTYTISPQRKELSASEILNMMPSSIPMEYDGPLMEFARAIEAKLKEVV